MEGLIRDAADASRSILKPRIGVTVEKIRTGVAERVAAESAIPLTKSHSRRLRPISAKCQFPKSYAASYRYFSTWPGVLRRCLSRIGAFLFQ